MQRNRATRGIVLPRRMSLIATAHFHVKLLVPQSDRPRPRFSIYQHSRIRRYQKFMTTLGKATKILVCMSQKNLIWLNRPNSLILLEEDLKQQSGVCPSAFFSIVDVDMIAVPRRGLRTFRPFFPRIYL